MAQSSIALIIILVMMILFVIPKIPMPVTAMLAAFAMAIFGLIKVNDIMAQFGTSNVFCVLGMMVVGGTLFETGLAQKIGYFILGAGAKTEKLFMVILLITVTVFSAFLSNTTTTAMFIPIVAGVAATSGGAIKKKNNIMLIGIAATVGGCASLMGSPSQHTLANTLLAENGIGEMSFFYGTKGTLVILAIIILYYLFIGSKLSNKVFDFDEVPDTDADQKEEKKFSPYKMIMSGVILVASVTIIALKWVSSGGGALIGAVACVVFGCVDIETAFKKINWSVIMMLGGLFAVAVGFNSSGAGKVCVNAVFSLFGTNVSPYLIYCLVVFVAMVMTNVVDNIATQALIAPIALPLALQLGLNPVTVVFSVLVGCNIAFATPISTPPMTMSLVGGYRFKDYLKVGGLLSIITYIGVIVIFPLIYGL